MLQIDQVIACLQSSVNQQGLLADKKREGRCPGDYFFFTVYVRHFSGDIEALDSKGILCTLNKGITSATECADVVGFTLAAWQIISCLLCKFCQKYRSLIYLQICEYLLWD